MHELDDETSTCNSTHAIVCEEFNDLGSFSWVIEDGTTMAIVALKNSFQEKLECGKVQTSQLNATRTACETLVNVL